MSAAVSKKAVNFTQFWRLAGLNYLDQLNASTVALRKVLKEPLRSESLAKGKFRYRDFPLAGDKELPPVEVVSDASMSKKA
jgi:Mitochondrial ATP synthase epsilon chain